MDIELYLILCLIIAAFLGMIPATIAKNKGYSFGLWWFYGWMLFIVAIIHASVLQDKNEEARREEEYARTTAAAVAAGQTAANQVAANQMAVNRAGAEQMGVNRAGADQMAVNRTAADRDVKNRAADPAPGGSGTSGSSGYNPLSQADELRKFKELMDMGVITEEEYQRKKAEILGYPPVILPIRACNCCGRSLSSWDEIIICPACRKEHHVSCWIARQGCATIGCPENRY